MISVLHVRDRGFRVPEMCQILFRQGPMVTGQLRSLTHPKAFTEADLSGTDRSGPVGAG